MDIFGGDILDLTLYLRLAQSVSLFVLLAFVAARAGILARFVTRALR